jgi:hypothetical protein
VATQCWRSHLTSPELTSLKMRKQEEGYQAQVCSSAKGSRSGWRLCGRDGL